MADTVHRARRVESVYSLEAGLTHRAMQIDDLPFEKIIFVCTNRREPGERISCAYGGGCALRDALKEKVKARGLKPAVRVSASGCMDRCEDGPNVMIFPDNVWLSGVAEGDLEPILDAVAKSLDTGENVETILPALRRNA